MPRVSVIIPTYNRALLISETLESVLKQTYRDFEVIVVDDGSTDDTCSILNKYDRHIRVIYQKNQGEGGARNTGISAANGEYVAFLDSDDLWLPSKLEQQMALFECFPQIAWVYCDTYAFEGVTKEIRHLSSDLGVPYEGQITSQLLVCDFIPSPTPVIRRSVFEETGLFIRSLIGVDWDMWLRIAAKYPIKRLPKVLAGYRIHEGSVFAGLNLMELHQGYIDTIENAISFAPEIYGPFRKQALAALCIRTGRSLAGRGQVKMARSMFLASLNFEWSGECIAYLLSCLIGKNNLRRLVGWRRRIKQSRAIHVTGNHG